MSTTNTTAPDLRAAAEKAGGALHTAMSRLASNRSAAHYYGDGELWDHYEAAANALAAALAAQAPAAASGAGQPDLHAAILNLPCDADAIGSNINHRLSYKLGHKAARHAAAELALAAAPAAAISGATPRRHEFVAVARTFARAYGQHEGAPDYLPRTQADAAEFEPHAWVIAVMQQVYADGRANGHALGIDFMKAAAPAAAPAENERLRARVSELDAQVQEAGIMAARHAAKLAAAQAPAAAQAQQWIPVSERLPEFKRANKSYLIWHAAWPEPVKAKFMDDVWWFAGEKVEPSHWMPLPPAPAGATGGQPQRVTRDEMRDRISPPCDMSGGATGEQP